MKDAQALSGRFVAAFRDGGKFTVPQCIKKMLSVTQTK